MVLDAHVGARDDEWQLARFDFTGGSLWARDAGLAVGSHVRVRVLARDVSISRHPSEDSSIQNLLPATITAIAEDEHPSLALVQARVGDSLLLARLTRRAAAQLALEIGDTIWLQVKSVALLE
ncbi:TOBE domain-containing protein [Candidatus Dactylopiibacterium carminicum]|uniref:TOBE domain-containing protein n=1 Tax=Candidatus Dactylopiibacterium carminicum TaxID=857335 RepID=UPI001CC28147|nr:TOBE domain-containing protein [Candidatus Dactylopiibacterium carminicum]